MAKGREKNREKEGTNEEQGYAKNAWSAATNYRMMEESQENRTSTLESLSTREKHHSFLIKLVNTNLASFADWKLVSAHFDRVIHRAKAPVIHIGYGTQVSTRLSLWTTVQSAVVC